VGLFDQRIAHGFCILSRYLRLHHIACVTLQERGVLAVVGAKDRIAFPVAGHGPILYSGPHQMFCRNHGGSHNKALAECDIGLFKTEVIYPGGPWKSIDPVEYATLEWVDCLNYRRLPGPLGNMPPAGFRQAYYDQPEELAVAA